MLVSRFCLQILPDFVTFYRGYETDELIRETDYDVDYDVGYDVIQF